MIKLSYLITCAKWELKALQQHFDCVTTGWNSFVTACTLELACCWNSRKLFMQWPWQKHPTLGSVIHLAMFAICFSGHFYIGIVCHNSVQNVLSWHSFQAIFTSEFLFCFGPRFVSWDLGSQIFRAFRYWVLAKYFPGGGEPEAFLYCM